MENKDEIRLKSVRRVDPHVVQIVDSAPRTALYNYEKDTDSWSKTDVEGTLMIYAREAPPYYMLIIINRLKKNNFMESITSACDIQDNPPFILFRNNAGLIFGIWFSDSAYVLNISSAIRQKISLHPLNQPPSQATVMPPVASTVSNANGKSDIMSMLSKAHNVYEHKKQDPNSGLPPNTTNDLVKPSPLRAGESTDSEVANFFARVGMSTKSAPVVAMPNQTPSVKTTPDSTNPVLQKLFQGAAAIGGQASVGGSAVSAPIPISRTSGTLPPHNTPKSSSLSTVPMSLQELEGKLKENLQIANKDESSQKSSLLSPHVFTTTSNSIDKDPLSVIASVGELPSSSIHSHIFPSPLASLVENETVNGSKENIIGHQECSGITPLTPEQLVQAFTVLLKKQDFVQQLHEAYIQALNQSFKAT